VTRFFIPLIDVLILLFCIFLLMPFVSEPVGPEAEAEPKPPEKPLSADATELRAQVRELQAQLREEQRRVAELDRRRARRLTDRLMVRVLEIDPKDGTLFYYAPDRREVRTEADAVRLITDQKTLAGQGGVVKDIFFLILLPRKGSPFPTATQIEQIKQWFKDVPIGFDTP
jgi:hypothetical protein